MSSLFPGLRLRRWIVVAVAVVAAPVGPTRAGALGPPGRSSGSAPSSALACGDPAEGVGSIRASVPFELSDNHLYVPATVEGTAPRSFLLDSGAPVTAVDWGVATRLDLPLRNPGSSRGAGPGTMRNARLPGTSVEVGGMEVGGGAPRTMPLDSVLGPFTGRAAPGIVGFPLFRERVVEVDFDARCVRVHDPATFAYRGEGTVLPLEVRNGWAHVGGVLGLPDGREVAADLIVDTGSRLSLLLTTDFVRRERLLASFPDRAAGTVGAGIGGETRFELARLPRLVLDTLTHRDAVVGLSAGSALDIRGFDGILGTEFLRRFRVYLDYAEGRLILEPGADRDDPERFDMSGLVLVAPRGADGRRTIRVHRVARGTPAAWAGVRVGDQILSVDGRSPPRLDLHEARRLLRGEPGTVRTLRVEREGRILTYVFALAPLI